MILEAYQPTPENDLLLLRWWERLVQLNELSQTLGQGAFSLSTFYDLFRAPRKRLLLAEQANVIQLAVVVEVVLSGAFLSVWIAPERRQSRAMLRLLEDTYEHLFDCFPVLLGVTRQARLLPTHAKWGYTVVGMVPHLFDGQDAWIVRCTKEDYLEQKKLRHRCRRQEVAA